uniref:Uncharacterized protein n=1 Tax=Castor canadensis TaxID=51338 RepID=A0A8C0XPS2_CASCN
LALWHWVSYLTFQNLSFLFVPYQHVSKEFDWLISDRGPFHHSRSYLSFVERHRQGFTTRYKIYRYDNPHLSFLLGFVGSGCPLLYGEISGSRDCALSQSIFHILIMFAYILTVMRLNN